MHSAQTDASYCERGKPAADKEQRRLLQSICAARFGQRGVAREETSMAGPRDDRIEFL